MTITKTEEEGKISLAIAGWLDVQTTPELHAYLEELPEVKELEFDFSELEYISSAGVREVVAAYRRQQAAEGTFAVVHVNPDVMDVFNMTYREIAEIVGCSITAAWVYSQKPENLAKFKAAHHRWYVRHRK